MGGALLGGMGRGFLLGVPSREPTERLLRTVGWLPLCVLCWKLTGKTGRPERFENGLGRGKKKAKSCRPRFRPGEKVLAPACFRLWKSEGRVNEGQVAKGVGGRAEDRTAGAPWSSRLPSLTGAAMRVRSSTQILFFTQLIPELFRDPISCQFILSCHSAGDPPRNYETFGTQMPLCSLSGRLCCRPSSPRTGTWGWAWRDHARAKVWIWVL